ncbi:MAG: histidine phosphatase family protein [Alphaproteobacteria bacterium]|nr:histidine phosphatase family protein [Alphaproteobacteria bacterium]
MDLPFDRSYRRRIHLMRHADAEYIRPDGTRAPDSRLVPLTPKGRAEAAAMATLMEGLEFDRAICSGLQRTRETAAIVLEKSPLTLEIVPELEEIRGGDAVARARLSPVDYAYAMFKASEPDACYASGERFSDFVGRVVPAFNRILNEPDWTNLLLVAHGGVNRAILTDLTGAGLSAFGSFEQDSACLNIIDIDTCLDSGAVLRRILRGVNITADDPTKRTRRLLTLEGMTKRFIDAGLQKPE